MLQQSVQQPQTKTPISEIRVVGAFTSYGRGIVAGNPKFCLKCHKPIRAGDAWTKHTSAADPEFGRYSIIVHARCQNKR